MNHVVHNVQDPLAYHESNLWIAVTCQHEPLILLRQRSNLHLQQRSFSPGVFLAYPSENTHFLKISFNSWNSPDFSITRSMQLLYTFSRSRTFRCFSRNDFSFSGGGRSVRTIHCHEKWLMSFDLKLKTDLSHHRCINRLLSEATTYPTDI